MARDDPHFNFRMPLEVREKLKLRAEANGRSMNSELLQIVQDALSNHHRLQVTVTKQNVWLISKQKIVKKMVFETLKKKCTRPDRSMFVR